MLRSLRQTTGSWVVKIFLGIVMLSFAVWGVGDILQGGGERSIAVVGDASISAQEFSNSYQREYQRLSSQLGGRLTTEDARNLGLVDATLQRMIDQTLIQQAASKLGLTASDAVIVPEIRANPVFRNTVGQFDPAIFEQALASNGFSEASFVAATRRDIARDQLLRAVTANTRAPKVMVDRFFEYRGEQRVAQLLIVPTNSRAEIAVPNDSTLQDYFRRNEANYTAPELRTVSYFTLRPQDLVADVVVNEEEIAEEYDIRRDEFVTLERREIQQLLYDDEKAAQAAHDRLARGDDLAIVAQDTGSLTADDVSLGLITKSGLPDEAREPAFALAEGQTSRPIKTGFGWHILRVAKIKPGSIKSIEDVKEQLRNEIALQHAGDALFDIANKIEDEFAGGASLTEAANRMNIAVTRLDAVDASGLDAKGNPITTLPQIAGFLRAVFETPIGEEPALQEKEAGTYFAVKVEEVVEPALRPFDSIRTKIREDWEATTRSENTRRTAEKIAEKIRSGSDVQSFSGQDGIRFKTSERLTRDRVGTDYDVSAELLRKIFSGPQGEVAIAPTPARDGFVVAKLTVIQAADKEASADIRTAVDNAMRNSIINDIVSVYRTALAAEYGVDVNQAAIDALF